MDRRALKKPAFWQRDAGKDGGYTVRTLSFDTHDDLKLFGSVYRPSKTVPEKGAIIVHHGFGSNQYDMKDCAEALSKDGFLVLAYDARGHNKSEGELDVPAMIRDVSTAIDFLDTEFGYNEVGILGHSLGGIVSSIATTKDERIKATISLSAPASIKQALQGKGLPYSTLYHAVQKYWPGHEHEFEKGLNFKIPGIIQNARRYSRKIKKKVLHKDTYGWKGKGLRVPNVGRYLGALVSSPRTIDYVSKIRVPYIIFNGGAETDITPEQAKSLYDACGSPKKELIIIEGGDHLYTQSYAKEHVAERAKKFFSEHLNGKKG